MRMCMIIFHVYLSSEALVEGIKRSLSSGRGEKRRRSLAICLRSQSLHPILEAFLDYLTAVRMFIEGHILGVPFSFIEMTMALLALALGRIYFCLPKRGSSESILATPVRGKANVLVLLGSGLVPLFLLKPFYAALPPLLCPSFHFFLFREPGGHTKDDFSA